MKSATLIKCHCGKITANKSGICAKCINPEGYVEKPKNKRVRVRVKPKKPPHLKKNPIDNLWKGQPFKYTEVFVKKVKYLFWFESVFNGHAPTARQKVADRCGLEYGQVVYILSIGERKRENDKRVPRP